MERIASMNSQGNQGILREHMLKAVAPFVSRLSLVLVAILFLFGLSPIFVDHGNIAHAADVRGLSQMAGYDRAAVPPAIGPIAIGETLPAYAGAGEGLMLALSRAIPLVSVVVHGDVTITAIKELEVELESEQALRVGKLRVEIGGHHS